MIINVRKDNKLLVVNVNLRYSIPMNFIKNEELELRTIKSGAIISGIGSGYDIKLETGENVKVVCTFRDVVYNNNNILLYIADKKMLLVIPDISNLFGLFEVYGTQVDGYVLGCKEQKRNDNVDTFNISHKFPVAYKEDGIFEILETELSKIKVTTIALNIPGTNHNNHLVPKYLTSENNGIINYNNSYISLGIVITFGTNDSIIKNDTISGGMIIGKNPTELRSKHLTTNPDRLKDFKKLFILE